MSNAHSLPSLCQGSVLYNWIEVLKEDWKRFQWYLTTKMSGDHCTKRIPGLGRNNPGRHHRNFRMTWRDSKPLWTTGMVLGVSKFSARASCFSDNGRCSKMVINSPSPAISLKTSRWQFEQIKKELRLCTGRPFLQNEESKWQRDGVVIAPRISDGLTEHDYTVRDKTFQMIFEVKLFFE